MLVSEILTKFVGSSITVRTGRWSFTRTCTGKVALLAVVRATAAVGTPMVVAEVPSVLGTATLNCDPVT